MNIKDKLFEVALEVGVLFLFMGFALSVIEKFM